MRLMSVLPTEQHYSHTITVTNLGTKEETYVIGYGFHLTLPSDAYY
jgi:hypothetical protein